MLNDPNLLRFTQVTPRKHEVTLLVLTRPEHPAEYLDFYRDVATAYAFTHKAKLISDVDVSLNPFRESAQVTFSIKGYKHPEKHDSLFQMANRNIRFR